MPRRSAIWLLRVALCLLVSVKIAVGRALRHGAVPSGGTGATVDVLFAADARVLPGLRVAIASLLQESRRPERLRLHVAVNDGDAEVFRKSLGIPGGLAVDAGGGTGRLQLQRRLPGGALLTLQSIGRELTQELSTLFPAENGTRPNSSSSGVGAGTPDTYARVWKPSNFVRFFIDAFMPEDSDRAIWLDADVVVQEDVTRLADSLLTHPSKTIAFARYPGRAEGFTGSYKIEDALSNHSWAAAHLASDVLRHPVWNTGVLAFNVKRMRSHRFRDRALAWIKLNREVQLYEDGGSQTPLDLAALVRGDDEHFEFDEVEPSWNCWWGFIGGLRREEELARCKVLHFADKGKPWAQGGERLPGFARWAAAESQAARLFPLPS